MSIDIATQRSGERVPGSVLEDVRAELDALPAEVLDLLLAAEVGAGTDLELLAMLLGCPADRVGDALDAARAAGLLTPAGTPVPLARVALSTVVPAGRRLAVRRRLAALQCRRGGPVVPLARSLLGTGLSGPDLATVFEVAAEQALPGDPALAARLFAAGAEAGRPLDAVAARWAYAAALAGDLGGALRLADHLITRSDAVQRAAGAAVAAAALAHRGELARGAELYRWAGTAPARAFAAVALVGVGRTEEVPDLLHPGEPAQPPTLLAGAAALMALGVHESLAGHPSTALSRLIRAADLLEPAGAGALLPDSPAALAAIVALHCGEVHVAEGVLARAEAARLGGPVLAARHAVLRGWVAMLRGDLDTAAAHLAGAAPAEARDRLFAAGLAAGIARRASDTAGLRRAWEQARAAVLRHPVDLYALLPLGELAIAAARLGEADHLAGHLDEADALLRRLGNPPLWRAPLVWARLHAALAAERTGEGAHHAAALAGLADRGRYPAALATAAACWLDALAGRVAADRVAAAARELSGVGLAWDAARLVGQAAIRTTDRRAMALLLELARGLRWRGEQAVDAPAQAADTGAGPLSEREREVAGLVLAGLTYKQVGDRLFISPKTVEHHVARMRHRLGCTSRTDLLDRLRALVG